jgi:hypothetical protein
VLAHGIGEDAWLPRIRDATAVCKRAGDPDFIASIAETLGRNVEIRRPGRPSDARSLSGDNGATPEPSPFSIRFLLQKVHQALTRALYALPG